MTRVVLVWLALSGAFLLGWWACIRLHLPTWEEEKVELGRALYQAHRKIADLERQREGS